MMKRKLLLSIVALLCTMGAWAQEAAGSYVYFNDFETTSEKTATGTVTGGTKAAATIKGDGSFASEGGVYGNVFQNVRGDDARSNYLILPDDVLAHSADSKALTIGFWVNKKTETDYYWSPIFSAYGSEPNPGNSSPMLWCGACKTVQYNVNDGNWCDFANPQSESSAWLDDGNWHYYTITFNGGEVKVYIDASLQNSWTLDDATDGYKISTFYTNKSAYSHICLGGNQRWNYETNVDKDPAFAFDDLYITNKALNPWDIEKIMFDKDPATYIAKKKGDLTSIINGDFQTNADGWSGGGLVTVVRDRGWRGTSYNNDFYETNYTGNLTYTLSNIPAGSYKVVAAVRGWDGTIKAQLSGTDGTTITCVGDGYIAGSPEINLNGVEMPSSNLGGFTTKAEGHNWRWITATKTLESKGDLTINFVVTSNSDEWRWFAMDDVHLYCTNYGGTSYTTTITTISNNIKVTNTDNNSVVTCDLVMSNPNCMIYPTGGVITTAAGETMNNNMVYTNGAAFTVANMVLYDGYPFTIYDNKSYYFTSATLYRSIPKDTWCTLVVPFWPTTSLTMKYPSNFTDGTLSFSSVVRESWANDKPMLIRSASDITSISGKRAGTNGGGNVVTSGDMISGSGVPMHGVYESGYVPQSTANHYYYAVGDEELHKVIGDKVTIKPFRAYFDLNEASGARSIISMNFDDEPTGVQELKNSRTEELKNYYNLNGQRVEKPAKGLYIVNGKKVIIK